MFKKGFIETIEPRSNEFEIINLEQFQMMLQYSKGSKFCTICTITEPDFKKSLIKDNLKIFNPYCNFCVKVARNNVNINFNYSNVYNNKLKKISEDLESHTSTSRTWGTRLKDSPFVSHVNKFGKHKLYLETNVLKVLDYGYWDIYSGLPLDKEKIEIWLRKKKEQFINIKDYDVEHIACILIDKRGYLIKENII